MIALKKPLVNVDKIWRYKGDCTLSMHNKNDSYMFYFDGTLWRYSDLNTKNGGIV